ncbi:UDP-GlcNAc:PI a1-6 GlcNAc-transferase, putative [Trypanosoma equiperdum]|nr:UDP-GlcNAc:PI a1-6 GlcNAc-transferase, putative [Trypanosoma equiperdum]
MMVTNTCIIMWPFRKEQERGGWLIGWNPHGLLVIVVAVVHDPRVENATAALNKLKESEGDIRATAHRKQHKDVPSATSLLILGWMHSKQATLDKSEYADAWVRSQHSRAELWLELNEGPLLHQLYCCGSPVQPCHLHVLRSDPTVSYAVTSTAFSAVARHDRGDLVKLVEGKMQPICVEGANSTLEGVLLPSHMVHSAGPRTKMRRMVGSDPLTQDEEEKQEGAKQRTEDDRVSVGSSGSGEGSTESQSVRGSETPRFGGELHPRLDFPTSTDYGELSSLLRASAYGKILRELCENKVSNATDGTAATARLCAYWKNCGNRFTGFLTKILVVFHLVLKWPGNVSYTAALLEFRLRMVIHWLLLLRGDTRVCCLHPVLPHIQHNDPALRRFCVVDFLVRFAVDTICGMLLSLLLSHGSGLLVTKAVSWCRWLLYDLHMEYMDWFEGWPAGLKMNGDLSMTLSCIAKAVLEASWASVEDLSNVGLFYKLLIFVAPLGASCAFAFVADLCLIASLHLYLVFHSVSLPYRFARFMLRNLFLQFQGKKHNPLRHRTDTYDFPVEQTLVATVIFTIIVFLLPTLAVYHVYFALICIAVWLLQGALLVAAHLTLYLPLYPLFYWALYRRQWPGGVALTGPKVLSTPQHSRALNPFARGSLTVEFGVVSKPLELRVLLADFLLVAHVVGRLHPFDMIVAVFKVRRWERTNPGKCLVPPLPADIMPLTGMTLPKTAVA